MLKICDDFSKEYDVVFNSSKIHLIIYEERRKYQKMVPLCLNGETLHIQRVATHLGHPVSIDNVNSIAIGNATQNLICRTNYKLFLMSVSLCIVPFCGHCSYLHYKLLLHTMYKVRNKLYIYIY